MVSVSVGVVVSVAVLVAVLPPETSPVCRETLSLLDCCDKSLLWIVYCGGDLGEQRIAPRIVPKTNNVAKKKKKNAREGWLLHLGNENETNGVKHIVVFILNTGYPHVAAKSCSKLTGDVDVPLMTPSSQYSNKHRPHNMA